VGIDRNVNFEPLCLIKEGKPAKTFCQLSYDIVLTDQGVPLLWQKDLDL
jgi:hypothetical protein